MPIAHWAVRRRPPELGDRNLAPTHSLAHLEALELRMVDVERLELGRILGGLGSQRPDCVAGHVRLELRNVGAKYPFESSYRFPGIQANSCHRDHSRLSCGR
jgi:hypothetical protein